MPNGERERQPHERRWSPMQVMSLTTTERSRGATLTRRVAFLLLTTVVLATIGGVLRAVSLPWLTTEPGLGNAPAAAITLSESRGAVGRTITVSGTGFASGEQVDIRWKSATATPLTSIRSTTSGAFSARITIPDAPIGQHPVVATGRTVTKQASAGYTVTPSLSRVPAEGAPWSRIAITARGFGANEDVRLNWLRESGPVLGTIRTNSAGIGSITITMPNGAPGWNDYTGYGLASRGRAWGALKILSSVTLSPTAAAPGATVQATARGFSPGAAANVAWNPTTSSAGTSLCRGTIATNGTLVCRFVVPQTGAGAYPVTVTAGSSAGTATLAVTGPPAVRIDPATGAVGTDITIRAGGLAPNESIAIAWDRSTTWRTVRSSSQGAISVRATVPALSAGKHTLTVRGTSSGKSASTTFTVASTPIAGATSRISEGVYSVYATREGLVGGTTSSGHRIVANDYFVSLPGCTPTNCPGGANRGTMTDCGSRCYVKVINPQTHACRVEPILDVGPWFRVDDWWNATSRRYLNALASNPNTLAQGYTGADAARNGLDVGYGTGPNGIGRDDTGTTPGRVQREVGNRSAIDLADGTWTKLGITSDGTGGRVTVQMLWQTGADPAAQARACGHPLNERPDNDVTHPPGVANPSFSGAPLAPTGSGGSPNSSGSRYAYDGYWSTAWYSASSPESGYFTIDYGEVYQLSGVRWGFNVSGYADQFIVQTSVDRATWTTIGTFGNAPRYSWYGAALDRPGRYVRVVFSNPNADIKIGYLAELELWGSPAETTNPPGTADPAFDGAPLQPYGRSGSSNGSDPRYVYDNAWSTTWHTISSPTRGSFTIDYGAVYQLSGVRWGFNRDGYADQFTVQTSIDRATWTTVGTFGNAPRYSWYGSRLEQQGRYLRVIFDNPNGDSRLGQMSHMQLWGTRAEPEAMRGSDPRFDGAPIPIVASDSSTRSTTPDRAHDGDQRSSWETVQSPPPAQATLTLDLGRSQPLTGIRWMYRMTGGADRMRLQISTDGATWTQLVTTSNRASLTWEGWRTSASARYVRLVFDNPNGDAALGYVAEAEVWGPTTSFSAARAIPAPERRDADAAATPTSATPDALTTDVESVATPVPAQAPAASPTEDSPDSGAATPAPGEVLPVSGTIATPDALVEPTPTADTVAVPTAIATSEPVSGGDRVASPVPTGSAGREREESDQQTTSTGESLVEEPSPFPSPTDVPRTETPADDPVVIVTGEGFITFTDGDGANCRVAPGSESDIISLLAEGTRVDLIGVPADGWQEVICDGQRGYVFAEFITDSPPMLATEPVAPPETPDSGTDSDPPTPEDQAGPIETPGTGDDTPDASGSLADDRPTAEPAPEPTPMPTEVPAPEPELVSRDVVIVSASDTSVTQANPSAPQSAVAVLELPAGGEDGAVAVLTFEVEGIGAGTVVDARLVLTGAAGSGGGGGRIRVVEGVWFDEYSVTWNDVSNAGGWIATETGSIQPGVESVVDVSGIVAADGTISFVIEGISEQPLAIASRESGPAAYLVLTVEEWIAPEAE